MNAETAGSGAVTTTPESQVENQTPTGQPNEEETRRQSAAATEEAQGASEIASNNRLRDILTEEGLPEAEINEVTKPKGKTNADKETETPTGDRSEEGAGDRGAEGDKARKTPKAPRAEGEGPEEVTEEERKAWPKEALDRIHKLTSQREEWKAKVAAAPKVQAARPQPTAEDPLADVETPEEMGRAVREYRDLREWAQENPDGLTGVVIDKDADGKPVTRDYSAKDMAAIVAKTTRVLDEHVPRKAATLQQQQLHEQVARERLPEMFEEGTDANKFYQGALRDLPELRRLPGMANMIRWAWEGRALDIERQKKAEGGRRKAEGDVDPKTAPFLRKHPPMAPGAPEARVSGNGADRGGGLNDKEGDQQQVTKAKERVEAGEGEEAEADFIGALLNSQARRKGGVLV